MHLMGCIKNSCHVANSTAVSEKKSLSVLQSIEAEETSRPCVLPSLGKCNFGSGDTSFPGNCLRALSRTFGCYGFYEVTERRRYSLDLYHFFKKPPMYILYRHRRAWSVTGYI